MWRSAWAWLNTRRRVPRPATGHDHADMGTEIGLDASLESRLPPLMENAASRTRGPADDVRPLGTDHRSRFA